MPKNNLVGCIFGRLTVKKELPERTKAGKVRWECVCTCDNPVITTSDNLKSGNTKSCGCLDREKSAERLRTHGQGSNKSGKRSPTYLTWLAMWQRCTYVLHPHYHNYGGRGIKVCDRWQSFENFYNDMGDRPKDKTIDRYPNPDGNYEPTNCRWASRTEQRANRSLK